jgi:hypothetical protein
LYRGAVLTIGWIRVLVLLLLCVQVLQFWWASRQPDGALSPLWWLADGAILMAIILVAVLQPFRAGRHSP